MSSPPPSVLSPPPMPLNAVSHSLFGELPKHVQILCVVAMFLLVILYVFILRLILDRSCGSNGGELPEALPQKRLQIEAPIFAYGGSGDDDEECAICLSKFEQGEKCRKMSKCDHVFHRDCIDRWLKAERHCPLCRTSICIVVHGGDNIVPPAVPNA
ncbi:RING-H2 finger protein ATL1-like [Momordica charantia]|uniref:RING-H2 finger protein ATL1-like n=1 Tax=Momordica charantia TaxID=3673 RepID=A0A6J1E0E9_MOMCH|nr:RING-H2 finger protein ATL1-like [Momordica charantia]